MRMEIRKVSELDVVEMAEPQFQLRDTSTNLTPAAQNTNDSTGSAVYNQLSL